MKNKDIYQKALDTFGAPAQTLMLFEEMSELQKELCKNARGKANRENIAEEIADVLIVISQIILLHGLENAVEDYKQIKLQRLKELLK